MNDIYLKTKQYLIERITSSVFLGIPIKDGKYLFDDNLVLDYFPVIEGTLYSNNKAISEELANSITWSPTNNYRKIVCDDLNNYYFTEHSLFLFKEHFKMLLKYSSNQEMKEIATKILEKLNKINE